MTAVQLAQDVLPSDPFQVPDFEVAHCDSCSVVYTDGQQMCSSWSQRPDGSSTPVHVHPDFSVFDIPVYAGDSLKRGLQQYYAACLEQAGLLVTTSCFATWLEARKTNGGAKLIPAIPASGFGDGRGQALRVIFFDDNINLHLGGSSCIDGICNLRDVSTGEYVDFSVGQNGFKADNAYRHTVIHHSTEYRNVLVQANILDAMANADYFSSIIKRYRQPGEKLLVFFDVNGTIVWDDTVSGKGHSEVLLSTMFRFGEVRPTGTVDFSWAGKPPVRLDRRMTLRQLVSEISNKDADFYSGFWTLANCRQFVHELASWAELGWSDDRSCFSDASFVSAYEEYMDEMQSHGCLDGITRSWFQVWEQLRDEGHIVVLNSFGVDSQRVVTRSVPDARQVSHITIDYGLWGAKDLKKWHAQFEQYRRQTGDAAEKEPVS